MTPRFHEFVDAGPAAPQYSAHTVQLLQLYIVEVKSGLEVGLNSLPLQVLSELCVNPVFHKPIPSFNVPSAPSSHLLDLKKRLNEK